MRRMVLIGALLLVAGLAVVPTGSGATASGDDVILGIRLGERDGAPIPGSTANGLNFIIFFDVAATDGVIQPVTLAVELPAGLHWGAVAPQPSDGCHGTAPAVCTAPTASNGVGTVGVSWGWDVVADRAGAYTVTATATPAQPDPNPANNTATFQIEVVAPTVPASVLVSAPTVDVARSVVTASVHVDAGGVPVRPTAVACRGLIGATRIRGVATESAGSATCRYRIASSAKGKTLHGTIQMTVQGRTVKKVFATKLG